MGHVCMDFVPVKTFRAFSSINVRDSTNSTEVLVFSMIVWNSCRLEISFSKLLYSDKKRSEEDKLEFNSRKAYTQKQFWEKLSLRVSQPKPGGYGNTNTGNTARRTGLKSELLYKLKIILIVINSKHGINYLKLEKYALQTALLYIDAYPWYLMTATLYKILVRGADVIWTSILPVGVRLKTNFTKMIG